MARRKKAEETKHEPISDERLRGLISELERAEEHLNDEKQAVKDIIDTAKGVGVHTKAMKAALRLSKQSAAEQNDYLACFQRCCDMLRVGMQREMFEDDGNVVTLSPSA